ncbi:MAG TPA: MoaD/ThiS family protein, partial [Chloroflexota bacterium]|nr:MoaD/ThiS family protein [Chloroflexota bacterium]
WWQAAGHKTPPYDQEKGGTEGPLATDTGNTALIQVGVRLYAGLRCYLPDVPLGKTTLLPMPPGTTVGDILDRLGIPHAEAHSRFVNGLHRDLDFTLSEGDEIAFFPPVAGGMGGNSVTRLRIEYNQTNHIAQPG